ncbi:TrbG/VirB9 family P-type conjugative transfer protein [Vibrio vulnificus]|uniref:TrbG/VirB9 family P-type conjugative transfer protein n=1 Tax=Vibrio vulnificus TaxID=672 RepID=UPI001CDBA0B7|nr:TrbG/VirB9 family P-type conjugative transfer protein [Vibrio vulnificus]MCA3966836.1 TrbG/VirB9 family P-type conjugative transfer protein [Vibrio vulnificus]
MNKWLLSILSLLLSAPSLGAVCTPIKHRDGEIIRIQSAKLLGGRIQLPTNLISKPIVSNPHLWDVDGVVGTNQIFLKPNSDQKEGAQTLIFAMTEDGRIFDIEANRVKAAQNQACLLVNAGSAFFSPEQSLQLSRFVTPLSKPSSPERSNGDIERLKKALSQEKSQHEEKVKKAVVDALQKYQYRIYTRYEWSEGRHFVGRDTVSDVYDDGQFTYIRLANPNRGILSVETVIGGKPAIAPTRYIDSYGMYKVTGIYPKFTLRLDDVTIDVQRRDNRTKGNT